MVPAARVGAHTKGPIPAFNVKSVKLQRTGRITARPHAEALCFGSAPLASAVSSQQTHQEPASAQHAAEIPQTIALYALNVPITVVLRSSDSDGDVDRAHQHCVWPRMFMCLRASCQHPTEAQGQASHLITDRQKLDNVLEAHIRAGGWARRHRSPGAKSSHQPCLPLALPSHMPDQCILTAFNQIFVLLMHNLSHLTALRDRWPA